MSHRTTPPASGEQTGGAISASLLWSVGKSFEEVVFGAVIEHRARVVRELRIGVAQVTSVCRKERGPNRARNRSGIDDVRPRSQSSQPVSSSIARCLEQKWAVCRRYRSGSAVTLCVTRAVATSGRSRPRSGSARST
jgi:hypothetical protein